MPLLTARVLRDNGWTHYQLVSAIRGGRFIPPPKDEGGRFVWNTEDVERLRSAIAAGRSRGWPREENRVIDVRKAVSA
jgi:hypothetical protein